MRSILSEFDQPIYVTSISAPAVRKPSTAIRVELAMEAR